MSPKRGPAARGGVTMLGTGTTVNAPQAFCGAESVREQPRTTTDGSGAASGAQALWMMLDPRLVARLSPNSRAQSHWPRTKARERVMDHTARVARVQGLRPVHGPVRITFRWVFPNRIRRDADNYAGNGCVKAILDALVRAEYLVDDSTEYVPEVRSEVVYEMGERRLEIVIEPYPPATGAAMEEG